MYIKCFKRAFYGAFAIYAIFPYRTFRRSLLEHGIYYILFSSTITGLERV